MCTSVLYVEDPILLITEIRSADRHRYLYVWISTGHVQARACLFGHICVCHHRLLLPLPSFATHRVEQAETCACAVTSVYCRLSACGSSLSASTTAEHDIEHI